MLQVIKDIARVSQTPLSVLITGETGTGKELIARTIHQQSTPQEPFDAINCAAIVSNLLESELFGHEKGAFTGAVQRKMGKLEAAGNGTIFMDEVAELSLDLQAKFLRVLQEKVFQRVGGLRDIPMKGRIVAATNRDLETLVEKGQFREDLYFRFKVFTIHVPPLRDRMEDIVPLAEYYISQLNRESNKNIDRIPKHSLEIMKAYSWPGNIRELQNVLRRTVIVSRGNVLELEDHWLQGKGQECEIAPEAGQKSEPLKSLDEMEREHVLKVLRHTGGNSSGSSLSTWPGRSAPRAMLTPGPARSKRAPPAPASFSRRTSAGYRLEAAIPFREIGRRIAPGQRLGFNVIVYDGDKPDAALGENINQSRIAWSPRPGVQGRPEDWGRIDLE